MWTRLKAATWERFRRASLKRKITIILFFAIGVIVFFSCTVFGFAIYNNSNRAQEQLLQNSYLQKADTLENYMNVLEYTAHTIMFSNWAQQYLMFQPTGSPADKQIYQRNVTHFLNSLASIHHGITFLLFSEDNEIAVYSDRNSLYFDVRFSIKEQPWYSQMLREKRYVEYGESDLFFGRESGWSMTMYYPVTSYYNFSVIGYLAVNVPAESLSFLTDAIPQESVVLTDRQGNCILSGGQEIIGENGSVIRYNGQLMDGDWNIEITRRNSLNLFSQLASYSLFFLLLIPIILILLLIDLWFSRYLTTPIVDCKNALLEIRNNHFGIQVENKYQDEISDLIDGLNEMSSALVTLLRQNERMDSLRRKAELEMLQEKVNPHFLYNTLEIINSMILGGRSHQAVNVCQMLGEIYHYNLSSDKWVTLRGEYEYVQQYLRIIQYKMEDLTILGKIDKDALEIPILKLVIQPLVENSVKHGFRGKHTDCCITLSIQTHGDRVTVLVMDNGTGIPQEMLEQIRESLQQARSSGLPAGSSHIGIRNIYHRLYLEYGGQLTFEMDSHQPLGTKIVFSIPKTPPPRTPRAGFQQLGDLRSEYME